MTTATAPVRVLPARPAADRRAVTFPRVVAAEWTKLLSLRSTLVLTVVAVVASAGTTYLAASASSGDPGFVPTNDLTMGIALSQVALLVLGILVGVGEFTSGTARTTFTAVPRRLPVLAAQVVVTTVYATFVGLLVAGAAVLAILPAASSRGITPDLSGDTLGLLAGMVALLATMAAFGLAVGALLRRSVPAIVAGVALVLVLPLVLMIAGDLATDPLAPSEPGNEPPQTVALNTVATLLPGGAGPLMLESGDVDTGGAPDLGRGGAALVVGAWILVPLAAAGVRLSRDIR